MFKQVYESVVLPYRQPADITGPFVSKLRPPMYPYLMTDPRMYGERIYFLNGIFVRQEETPKAHHTVHVVCNMEIYWYPGHTMRHMVFDGVTGEYVRDDTPTDAISTYDLVEGADGSLWMAYSGWSELDPLTMKRTGLVLDNSKYGESGNLLTPMIDKANNILIHSGGSGLAYIKVHEFDSGTHLRDIQVSGRVSQIIPESGKYAYVYCDNGMLNLVDYVEGSVLSTFKAPAPTGTLSYTFTGRQKFAYDRFTRRLLACQMVADNVDGSSNTNIKGWYPVPQPVGMTKPIPITQQRVNKPAKYAVRLYGDAGEPISGYGVTAEITGVTATVTPGLSDSTGYAILQAKASTDGAATITATTEIVS